MTLSYYCQFVIYPAKVVVKTESESDDNDFNLSNVRLHNVTRQARLQKVGLCLIVLLYKH